MSDDSERTAFGEAEAPGADVYEDMPAQGNPSVDVASQWQLMRWKFMRHKAAVVALWFVIGIYAIGLFCEILAPQDPNETNGSFAYAPPMGIHLFEEDGTFNPHVKGLTSERDRLTFRLEYAVDPEVIIPIRPFVKGDSYRMWGLFEWDRHLFGTVDPEANFFLLGADRLGRDNFSRIIYGTRVSLSIGLVGVALSLAIGLVLGGVSGYYGGRVDNIIQRVIEFLRSMPTIPLWMGLAAAIPLTWPPLGVYFMITILLSLIGWTSLGRETRGKVMSLKNEDFVIAARLDGVSEFRIITRHLLPAFMSHTIAVTTLAIPQMILAETALSFLGIGLQAPVVSWGVLLQEAQNVNTVATAPWLLLPGVAVVVAVLALNFLGDGLRDAADPYAK
ncbi:ABC transporter permease [Roseivivax sp. GX 12232]|uniref:ABC transporter permease n=1 Tax=Roseivivax sp. GX 12232 TaxID=2900547 RepID=UPI001E33A6DA|nr:ABC transporter permease [Roseivivax sp. GX 12232]